MSLSMIKGEQGAFLAFLTQLGRFLVKVTCQSVFLKLVYTRPESIPPPTSTTIILLRVTDV